MRQKGFLYVFIANLFLLVVLLPGAIFAGAETKVTVALPHDLTSLNPFKARVGQDNNVYMALYEPLFIHETKTGATVNCLVESYEFFENKKDILVKIRKSEKHGIKVGF